MCQKFNVRAYFGAVVTNKNRLSKPPLRPVDVDLDVSALNLFVEEVQSAVHFVQRFARRGYISYRKIG